MGRRSQPTLIALLLVAGAAAAAAAAAADNPTSKPLTPARDFPSRSVQIVEPFGAGGGPDLLARALGEQLGRLWGHVVRVENVPGAGATAAPARVASESADGHTLLINTNAHAYSAALVSNLSYDPLEDFEPVAALTRQPYVLVAGKAAGVATVGELIAAAKARPGKLVFTSAGIGTGTHIGIVQFNRAAGIDAIHRPAKPTDSNADTISNAIEGRTDYYLAPISLALPAIRDGGLVPLAVSTARRSSLLPGVPSIVESGIPGFDFPIWYGIWVRAGTDQRNVERLAEDIGRVMAGPEMLNWIATHGAEPMRMSRTEFAHFVRTESENAIHLLDGVEASP